MRETKKSLKAYFIIIGILGTLSGIYLLTVSSGCLSIINPVIIRISGAITIILSAMFFYYGIRLYDYLQRSPKTLISFVVIAFIIEVILSFLDKQTNVVIYFAGGGLLSWYLIHSIKKLSTQTNSVGDKK